MSTVPHRIKALVLSLLLSLAFLGGCASTNNPRDPMEPMNRAFYSFNDGVDNALLKPIAEGYRAVLPSFARTGVSNFFSNINDVLIALNNLLQGKIVNAISDLGRVVVNTTIGVLGLMDPATEIGLEKHNEDFGQTLGYWGIGDGAYLVIPLLGPSNVRDAVGKVVDFKTDPITYVNHMRTRNVLWGTRIISNRADLLDTSKILEAAALDPYEFVRDAYLQRRRNLVHDGSPPPDNDNDGDIKMKPRTEVKPYPVAEQTWGSGGIPWQSVISGRADNWTPAREEAAAAAAQEPARLKAAQEPAAVQQPQMVRVWAPQTSTAQ
jgi:phospholipid-binding lipoprotein MlaA